jgi:hypothetical protein
LGLALSTDHLPFILHGSLVGACFFEMGKDVRDEVLSFNAMCSPMFEFLRFVGFLTFWNLATFLHWKGTKSSNQFWILQLPAGSHACLFVVYLEFFGLWEKVHCFCSLHSIITWCVKTIHKSSPWMTPKSGSFHELIMDSFLAVDKQSRFLSLQYFVSSASLRNEIPADTV